MKYLKWIFLILIISIVAIGCENKAKRTSESNVNETDTYQLMLNKYVSVPLTSDLSGLSDQQKKMLPLLMQAADIMDELFWYEAYGEKDSLLSALKNPSAKQFVIINYGPWDRLSGNKSFVDGIGEKPLGANFYPTDMSKMEFDSADLSDKTSLYTLIRRDENGELISIPYHIAFEKQIEKAAGLLEQAVELSENPGFRHYLKLRAVALRNDEYFESDMAWMDMKDNQIDMVIGPIENYEDKLYNYKAAHEAYVLIKDMDWSKKLEKFAALLPQLQRGLPVSEEYKKEKPGSNADLNAYDVVYYAGDCNSGSKTIAINLPNDEKVQLVKGSRRLQLKNAMRAKFDKILVPIANELIDESQRQHIKFDAFFANTMFHEVAHGLGIKNTLTGKGSVRSSLKEHFSAIEEGKADILGIYMIAQLLEMEELQGDLKDNYVTFMAGIFRSVRFGAASAHGKANMMRFNYFQDMGAFTRDNKTGTYKVDFEKMQKAVNALSEKILILQGQGDYDAACKWVEKQSIVTPELQSDLNLLDSKNIPVDVVFSQGGKQLGL